MFQFKRYRDYKIRTKLMIGFLLILIPLAFILVAVFYTYSAKIISHQTLEQTRETVEQFSNSLDNYMSLMSNKMEVLSDSPTIQEELNAPSDEVNQESDSFYSRNKQIRRIMLQEYSSITTTDMELYGNNGTNYYLSVWSEKPRIPYEASLFQKANEAKGKWIVWNEESDSETLQMMKVVKDLQTYTPIGYVRIGLKRSYIQKMSGNINFGNDGSITILDQSLNKISGKAEEQFVKKMSQETSSRGNFSYGEGKNECTVVYAHSNITGWNTIGFIPSTYIKKDLEGIRNLTIVLIFFAVIIGISISIAIARSLVSPLEDTADALEQFSQGDFEVRLSENRGDEIGKVNLVFNKAIKDINELMQKVTQGETLNKEMEFKTLQSQMNPHFLYNTLDAINWMAFKEKQTEICNLVTAISNLIRVSISNKQSIITLEQEFDYVKDYLYIQQIRYKDRFETIYDIDDSILNQTVPKLIVQPVVENAVVHGIENTQSKNFLYISVKREDEMIYITVRDTGIGMSEAKIAELLKEPEAVKSNGVEVHTNLGLYAVHKRLQFMYGESYGLTIESREGVGTTVTLRIPYMQEPQKLYEQFNDLLGK